jgi:4-amino-4-deoxychorismate lyase
MNACLINGTATHSVSTSDRGLQYGDGVFETIAVHHGMMSFWAAHYARLVQGCERLQILVPSEAVLLQEIDQLKQNQLDAVIKIILTRGDSKRGYRIPNPAQTRRIVQCFPYPDYPKSYATNGIAVIFCKTPVSENKYLAGIKHLNRLDNVMASSEWSDSNIAEGFMLDASGHVIQGTKSNIFCVQEGVLHTPDLSCAGVAGIMRFEVLRIAKTLQIPINIGPITQAQLLKADEIFITNSIIGLWPVARIDQQIFTIGHLTQQLLQQLK